MKQGLRRCPNLVISGTSPSPGFQMVTADTAPSSSRQRRHARPPTSRQGVAAAAALRLGAAAGSESEALHRSRPKCRVSRQLQVYP
jgi:hypothetical protein